MTLSIDAWYVDENGKSVDLPLASHLGGFESTRYSFYCGKKALDAGLVLLPSIGTYGVLEVRGDELAVLKREVEVLIALLDDDREYWEFRLGNLLEAIALATPYAEAGCVSIG